MRNSFNGCLHWQRLLNRRDEGPVLRVLGSRHNPLLEQIDLRLRQRVPM
jgi:hypothetical protein